jgi:hypothetical protein
MTELVLEKIKNIRKRYGKKPQCYLVATILSSNFGGVVWYNNDHCVTLIDEEFYDKRGVVPIEEFEQGGYLPIHEFGIDIEASLIDALIDKTLRYDRKTISRRLRGKAENIRKGD